MVSGCLIKKIGFLEKSVRTRGVESKIQLKTTKTAFTFSLSNFFIAIIFLLREESDALWALLLRTGAQ